MQKQETDTEMAYLVTAAAMKKAAGYGYGSVVITNLNKNGVEIFGIAAAVKNAVITGGGRRDLR